MSRKNGKKGPSKPATSQPVLDGEALDALLESKYSHGLYVDEGDDQGLLQGDDADLNDVTFGNELEEGEFDFGQNEQSIKPSSSNQQRSNRMHQQQPQSHQIPNQGVPLQQRQQQHIPPQHHQMQQAFNQRPPPSFMQSQPQTTMSLEQIEAQMRGGAAGIPPNPSAMNQQQIFARPPVNMIPGSNQMMGMGLFNQQPMQQFRPGNQLFFNQQQQQQFMMRPGAPMQPFNPQVHPPSMRPAPIVIDGISVTPVDITNQEKDAVFAKLQAIQPMIPHIDTLLNTIFKLGGEKETENLRRLVEVKNLLRVQFELINRGIFVIRADVAQQLHSSLLQFFQYGESLMKKTNPAPEEKVVANLAIAMSPDDDKDSSTRKRRTPSPVRQSSPVRQPSPVVDAGIAEMVDSVVQDMDNEAPAVSTPTKTLKILKRKDKSNKNTAEPSASQPPATTTTTKKNEVVETVKFDDMDFPVLGKDASEPVKEEKSKEPQIRIARQGNQKQRREEKQKHDLDIKVGAISIMDEGSPDDDIVIPDDSHLPRAERYAGLMRKHEKELIAKIQISQLVSDDPFSDDFYFQMCSLKKKREAQEKGDSIMAPLMSKRALKMKNEKGVKWHKSANQLIHGKSSGTAVSNQMQQQMKRLIESRRALKPREDNSSLEGALGKIAPKSTRAPKQAIQVAPTVKTSSEQSSSNVLLSLADFKVAEAIFDAVLRFEDFDRKVVPKGDDAKALEAEKENARLEIWRLLAPGDEIPLSTPHPLCCSLNHTKGLIAANRALSHLDTKQSLGFFSIFFNRLECLNVCNYKLGSETEKVETFMNNILPVFTNIISDADMSILSVFMRIVLERHNLVWLAKSRVGLVLLTMILSRAELVKQNLSGEENGDEAAPLPPNSQEELEMWGEIYDFMFQSFQGQFPSLFSEETLPADEVYVWQFFSAMAVGASGIDHQKILVTELRDNIIQTAKTNHPKALENVNLFLDALGLNITASQLAGMA